MESYRDEQGRPCQRLIANLHGEPTPLKALAKLAALRHVLLEQREEEHAEPSNRGAGFVLVTERALTKYNRRMAQIDRQLATIEREISMLAKHCTPATMNCQRRCNVT